jgi:cystathionine beta-lyase/cystathionine gamma-synthase
VPEPSRQPTGPSEARPGLHAESRAIRAGRADNDTALAPILWATTTFVTSTVEEGRRLATTSGAHRFYSRYGNPTVRGFEEAIADLEGAETARAFASGMGAISAVVLGLCSAGDHIVAQRQLYAGTQLLLQHACPRFGIDVTFVDATEPGAFAAAVRPGHTVLVLAETPANPRLDLADLDEVGAIVGPITVVDSTFAWLYSFAVLQGANASPFDAMNGLRGLRTLGVRLQRQSDSAVRLAEALEGHPEVEAVLHPGLASHPQHELALRQMALPGGLLTFDVRGGVAAGSTFVEAVRLAQLATSLGGPETLVTHPASTTHVNLSADELTANRIGEGTVRVSVGLEHPDDIVADFLQALEAVASDR